MPWKNGGGVTTEICVSPPSGAFDWRVSIATVNADGPFSTLHRIRTPHHDFVG